ncbi:subtilisin-like serine protease [Mortierella sp. GBA35]|nr:subtilisin-like serine protease [Mortierella sp. AD031]KAF9090219.1 subtilisin-like serine protease [Mortierella sp. GBA35]KAG0206980.1 subtilisin-like serine protease [Mortierella sp. NVP41]
MKYGLVILALVAAVQAAPLIAPTAGSKPIPDSYIVVLKDTQASSTFKTAFDGLAKKYNGRGGRAPQIHREYSSVFPGFHATLDAATLKVIQANPDVAYVEQDAILKAEAVQASPPSWGLVRISQHVRNLNPPTFYYYNDLAGLGVTAYVIDTGIYAAHSDFGARASNGANFIAGSPNTDENGHGTHIAGTIGGTIFGVAKKVKLVGVKVLDKNGSGSTSGVIAGMDWVIQNHTPGKAVVNMSLGGGKSTAIDAAAARMYAANIPLFAAAGGSATNACLTSPGGAPNVYTVASTDSQDKVASFASTGPCVEIFAPGSNISSTWIGSPTASNTLSGSSMSTGHVTGAAALFVAQGGLNTAQAVYNQLSQVCTVGVIVGNLNGAPNCLLYNGGP